MTPRPLRSVVLAYSGGLDTSIIVPWLKQTRPGVRVIAMIGDVGQPEDLEEAERRARISGADEVHVEDLRQCFLQEFAFPALRAGAVYENGYLLGTALARPPIARRQVELARRLGAEAVCHGATGKGNDQIRFELGYAALAPELSVIAPWREWSISSREDALAYAREQGIELAFEPSRLYSRDANLWHTSHEGGPLEDPTTAPEPGLFLRSVDPRQAPADGASVRLGFECGVPVSLDGERLEAVELVERLNRLAGAHGVGRIDLVENRALGIKSRGIYETPGATLLAFALRELEGLVHDRDTLHMKQTLSQRYAELVYDGLWFTPLRDALEAFMESCQARVSGEVGVELCRGNLRVLTREAAGSLYDAALGSFAMSDYDPRDAAGWIRLHGLTLAARARQPTAPELRLAPRARAKAAAS